MKALNQGQEIKDLYKGDERILGIFRGDVKKYAADMEVSVDAPHTDAEDGKNEFYEPLEKTIQADDGHIITGITVEMGESDITKQAFLGPFSAEIFGKASGQEENDMVKGDSYSSGTITPDPGYGIAGITVQMGDDDITSSAVSGDTVSVPSVSGDVAVNVETACQVVETPFLHRVTGGGLTLANTNALIKSIKGNTLVWNQLIPTNSTTSSTLEVTFTNNGDGSWTLSGTSTSSNYSQKKIGDFTRVKGHKYYVKCIGAIGECGLKFSSGGDRFFFTSDGEIISYVSDGTTSFYLVKYPSISENVTLWPILIDLTLMFGAGKEPSSVAEFEALFPLGYYANDSGRLLNFKGESLVSKDSNNATIGTFDLDVTSWTGKLNGEGSSVAVFPSGLKSAGSVYDRIYKEDGIWKGYVPVGTKNLGDCTWNKGTVNDSGGTTHTFFYTTGITDSKRITYTLLPNQCNSKGFIGNNAISTAYVKEKTIVINSGAHTADRVYIVDSSFANNTKEEFKTAMSGVMLNYELATPQVYVFDDAVQALLNTILNVETGGLETIEPANDDEPATSPAVMDIQYGTSE